MLAVTARSSVARLLVCAASAAAAVGCASVPAGRSAVDVVTLIGTKDVPEGSTTDKLATTESPRFLGLFRGVVYDYATFDAAALQRDLARIERYYRSRGFFEAHARTARVISTGQDHVRVEILVEEGRPAQNRRIAIDGLESLPGAVADDVRQALEQALAPGARFEEETYRSVRTTLTRAMTDRGYAYARVDVDAEADLPAHAVDYTFKVDPGPASKFGATTIVSVAPDGTAGSLGEIEESPVRRALHLRQGAPYSTDKIDSATQALLDLKVFSSVQIEPQLADPPQDVVPLVVRVSPSKLRSVKLGAGLELDEIKTDVHGLIGWEDLNFFGDLRSMTVEFEPGVVLFPERVNSFVSPGQLKPLLEEHLRAQLNQKGFIEPRTSLFFRPEVNVYPLLVAPNPDPNAEVVGYLEPRGAVGLDRRFGRHFFATLAHNIQTEFPIDYSKGQFDQTLPSILLSYPQLTTRLDYRDDQVHPHAGLYVANDLQIAGLGGNAQDLRIEPEVRGYLPVGKKVTLAARAAMGFLFALNYGDYVHQLANDRPPAASSSSNTDIEIAYFRGFFSGGPGSNRGFPVRGIAPHWFVPFLNPGSPHPGAPGCTATSLDPACEVPIGGFTLWESSIELRFDVSGPLGAATFCDAGDVSPTEANVRLDHLHLSCGAGVRYDTPVGPLRLDVGYRVQPLQVLGYANEDVLAAHHPAEGIQPKISYVPLAIAFGLGEAF